MKFRIISIVLCLVFTLAAFSGCVTDKPKTFKEAAEAGESFAAEEGLKNVKLVCEAPDKKSGEQIKITVEGVTDPAAGNAVYSLSIESKDTVHTFKELIKKSNNTLYVKIPETSAFEGLVPDESFGGFGFPSGGEPADNVDGLEDIGIIGGMDIPTFSLISGQANATPGMKDIAGKYIAFRLPVNKPVKLEEIAADATEMMYEKAEKADAVDGYPYVVKLTLRDSQGLLISVLDGIKENKDAVISEIVAVITEYVGEETLEGFKELVGKSVSELMSEGLDKFFEETKPEDLTSEDEGDYDCIQKIAVEKGRRYERVTEISFKNEDGEKTEIKTVYTVTAAEPDPGFADKCAVKDEEIYDAVNAVKENIKAISSLKKMIF